MGSIFLGKPWHWALGVAIVAALWLAGGAKLHVIQFNLFLTAIAVGSLVLVLIVIWTTRKGEQVTRDPLEEGDQDIEMFDGD